MWHFRRLSIGAIMQVNGLTKRLAIAAAVIVGAAFEVPAANANAIYNFSGDFGPPAFTATVSLDVVGGQALSGTGTIAFGAKIFDLTLITLATDDGNGNYGGQTGFRDNNGADIFGGDTTAPIDGNGLIFAISNNPLWGQDALFAAWDNGGGTFAFLISGALAGVFDVWVKTSVGTGIALEGGGLSETPLPGALPLFATGLGALGLLARRRKRKAQATT
jgi:hypothetical protein